MKKIFLLIGGPGSGKTSTMEAMELRTISHYSIGAMYRQLSEENSELGKEVSTHIDKGQVVPKHIARKVIDRFINEGLETIVIDAFPRDMEQALMLEDAINGKAELCSVIELMVDEELALSRITKRARGADDNPDLFKERMRVYNNEIKEIRTFYESQKKYIAIDGSFTLEDTVKKLRSIILQEIDE